MNPSYLKKYVQMHPGNKMAWYLLGKEYERSGQAGKANYCFNKAGHIYEAFESSKVPAEVWKEYEAKLLEASELKERRSRRNRKLLVALVLLLFLFIPSMDDPGIGEDLFASVDSDTITDDFFSLPEAQPVNTQKAVSQRMASLAFTARAAGGSSKQSAAMGELLSKTKPDARLTAVLGMRQQGRWLLWKRDMPVLFTVERDTTGGRAAVQSYDAQSCDCKPPDAEPLRKRARQWTKEQEANAVVASAVQHYRQKNGSSPKKLDDLRRPYPNNWIAGSNPELQDAFELAVRNVNPEGSSAGKDPSKEAEQASVSGAGADKAVSPAKKAFFTQPLEILVDKKNHTLVLVSGNIVVRSYKVGLGADRTPEGTYAISEKVMNPNGRPDGEFGSRGMQLSDTNYAIHGTNEPDSVGKDESLGCIRMSKEDVEELFDLAPMGTKVTIGQGIAPEFSARPEERFILKDRPDQTNPRKTYHWLF